MDLPAEVGPSLGADAHRKLGGSVRSTLVRDETQHNQGDVVDSVCSVRSTLVREDTQHHQRDAVDLVYSPFLQRENPGFRRHSVGSAGPVLCWEDTHEKVRERVADLVRQPLRDVVQEVRKGIVDMQIVRWVCWVAVEVCGDVVDTQVVQGDMIGTRGVRTVARDLIRPPCLQTDVQKMVRKEGQRSCGDPDYMGAAPTPRDCRRDGEGAAPTPRDCRRDGEGAVFEDSVGPQDLLQPRRPSRGLVR